MTLEHGHLLVLRGHHVPDLDQSQLSTRVSQSQLTLTRWSWPTLATTPSASGWHFTIVHLSSCAGTCNQIFLVLQIFSTFIPRTLVSGVLTGATRPPSGMVHTARLPSSRPQ